MAKQDRKMSTTFVTTETLAQRLSEVLRAKFASFRKPAATLADNYGWGDRKAKGVYQGTLCPPGADLLNMMARDDDVFEMVIEMTGRQAEWERQRKAIREILEGSK
jgi:hypothetical protein